MLSRLARSVGSGAVRRAAVPKSVRSRKFIPRAFYSSNASDAEALLNSEREFMDYDVLIVGAGPAGLSAAIKLKQLEAEKGREISVCVVEKAAEVGAHILSGNVLQPTALEELFPDWRELKALGDNPTPVSEDHFKIMISDQKSINIPTMLLPPVLHNNGNYIISLGKLVRWLGEQAEELGVEIYPGFAASEVLFHEDGSVEGVGLRDVGIGKDGVPKASFERGMGLRGRQTLFSEGARGSCTEELMDKFNLREGKDMQSYALGVKEVWEVPEEDCKPGLVQHSAGWPMDSSTYGGSFLYHQAPNKVMLGFVVGLDYENPYLSPYQELQRWKHHPDILKHIQNGECVSYGARVINEGGYQAIPKLTFPGGALVGCSAGFLNLPKVKGTHTAMKSGIEAAKAMYDALVGDKPAANGAEITAYEDNLKNSWVYSELKAVRNCGPAFAKWGLLGGSLYTSFAGFISHGLEPWTFSKHGTRRDNEFTKKAKDCKPIEYPKPDGKISFDILTNLARSGTNHEADQPSHLRIKPELKDTPTESITEYAGPEQRFCPARVYEYVSNEDGKEELVINAQNCLLCKACSIKMKNEYINWTVPEGGGGPSYEAM